MLVQLLFALLVDVWGFGFRVSGYVCGVTLFGLGLWVCGSFVGSEFVSDFCKVACLSWVVVGLSSPGALESAGCCGSCFGFILCQKRYFEKLDTDFFNKTVSI